MSPTSYDDDTSLYKFGSMSDREKPVKLENLPQNYKENLPVLLDVTPSYLNELLQEKLMWTDFTLDEREIILNLLSTSNDVGIIADAKGNLIYNKTYFGDSIERLHKLEDDFFEAKMDDQDYKNTLPAPISDSTPRSHVQCDDESCSALKREIIGNIPTITSYQNYIFGENGGIFKL